MSDQVQIDGRELRIIRADGKTEILDLYGKAAFEYVSELWLKLSWNQKYSYTFTWLGRPLIQHPEDLIRVQEAIFTVKPDVIIETGVAHGGSLIFYASLFEAMGKGRAIGVDVEIRPHNRAAIEAHPLFSRIDLVEGNSVDDGIVGAVADLAGDAETVMVILDSNHTRAHVLAELRAYARFVSSGSYIVATDGIMALVHDTPRGNPSWTRDNPVEAVHEFLAEQSDFELVSPAWLFNESDLDREITGWTDAWLRRKP
jgi:cephalosporin hydroxylase